MTDTSSIGLIGSGNMAAAMVRGWVAADPALAARIHLTDRGSGRAAALAEAVASDAGRPTVHTSNRELVSAVDVVLLCVKPIDIEDVLREVSDRIEPHHVVASVAAGGMAHGLSRPSTAAQALRQQLPKGMTETDLSRASSFMQMAESKGVSLTWPEALARVTKGRVDLTDLQRWLEQSQGGRPVMSEERFRK